MKNILVKLFFSAFIILNISISAQWVQSSGAEEDVVNCFAFSNTNVFAGADGGIYFSADNGINWTAANSGLPSTSVQSLLVNNNNIFAGTYGEGVFLSIDNGTTWTAVNNGLTQTDVRALVIIGENLFAGTALGVFLSTDNGSNWTEVSTGLPFVKAINSLAVGGNNLFAGTARGVYLSLDNGSNWNNINDGLPSTTNYTFAINGDNVFIGTDAIGSSGVYLTADKGTSWTVANNGLQDTVVRSLALSELNLIAGTQLGVYLSMDNGSNWADANNGLPTNTFVKSLAINGNTVFAGTNGQGIWLRSLSELTDVENTQNNSPKSFSLDQNYPNPFNPTTVIKYRIPEQSNIKIEIFNILGQKVNTLVNEEEPAGFYEKIWNASKLSSGIYLISIRAEGLSSKKIFTQVKKALLLK